MRRAGFAGVLIALAIASAAFAAEKGHIGGPPTMPIGEPDEGTKTTEAVVIGAGHYYGGRVEIVAHGYMPPTDSAGSSKSAYCVLVEYPPAEIDAGPCASTRDELENGVASIDEENQQITPKRKRNTVIGGRLSADVASVRVTFRRKGENGPRHKGGNGRSHAKATLAKVRGSLQQGLGLDDPFGYFNVRVRGLVPLKSFRVKALDADGKVLGTVKGF